MTNSDQGHFLIFLRIPSIAKRSSPGLLNIHLRRIFFTFSSRKKPDGAESCENSESEAFFILFASRKSRDALSVYGRALLPWTSTFLGTSKAGSQGIVRGARSTFAGD
jgi:hypothetical protein